MVPAQIFFFTIEAGCSFVLFFRAKPVVIVPSTRLLSPPQALGVGDAGSRHNLPTPPDASPQQGPQPWAQELVCRAERVPPIGSLLGCHSV